MVDNRNRTQIGSCNVDVQYPIGADLPGLVVTDFTLHAAYQRATSCKDAKPLTTEGQAPALTTSR